MNLPIPTPAPKPKYSRYIALPYMYAIALVGLAVWQLARVGIAGVGSFLGQSIEPAWIIAMSAAEVFAVPFLLRMNLSPLARACSATLALIVPVALLADMGFEASLGGVLSLNDVSIGAALLCLGIASFVILNGLIAVSPASVRPLRAKK